MRSLYRALCLLCTLPLAAALLAGCGSRPTPSGTQSTTTQAAADTTAADASDASSNEGDVTTEGSDSNITTVAGATKAPGGSKATTAKVTAFTGTLNNIPNSEKDKWGTAAGLASTKKVPDWMKKITSGTLVGLGIGGDNSNGGSEEYAYQKTLFKALTGKELKITSKLVEWNALRSTLQTMVLAGNGPDVFSIYNGVAVYLRNKGLARNIKDYINMNDAAWSPMKSSSEVMFFKGELTGVTVASPNVTGGIMYNKTVMSQAGLEDPWKLYQQKKWNITKFLEYVEELTVDADHDNKPEVFGVSMAPEMIFRMALSSGEDLVKINADGSFTNNLRSATFTRWASYARRITAIGSYDTESWTGGQRFIQGKIAMAATNIWGQFASKDLIAMKKAGKLGWVPFPMDINAKTYYHCSEQQMFLMPKNSKNPQGAAAYLYMLRYANLNPSAEILKKDKAMYMNDYGWTAEEYEFQRNLGDYFTPITFNWQHIPDFSYSALWNVFTEDWSKLVEEVYPSLQSAINAQNK